MATPDELGMGDALSSGINSLVRGGASSGQLFAEHTRKAPKGETTRQDPDDPILQARAVCAIVDAESAGANLDVASLVKLGDSAGLTSDTVLAMMCDPQFQERLEDMRFSVLVGLKMGSVIRAAVEKAEGGNAQMVAKLIEYQERRAKRRSEIEASMVLAGNRDAVLESMRRARNRLSRLIEALEAGDSDPAKQALAEAIVDEGVDPDRQMDVENQW